MHHQLDLSLSREVYGVIADLLEQNSEIYLNELLRERGILQASIRAQVLGKTLEAGDGAVKRAEKLGPLGGVDTIPRLRQMINAAARHRYRTGDVVADHIDQRLPGALTLLFLVPGRSDPNGLGRVKPQLRQQALVHLIENPLFRLIRNRDLAKHFVAGEERDGQQRAYGWMVLHGDTNTGRMPADIGEIGDGSGSDRRGKESDRPREAAREQVARGVVEEAGDLCIAAFLQDEDRAEGGTGDELRFVDDALQHHIERRFAQNHAGGLVEPGQAGQVALLGGHVPENHNGTFAIAIEGQGLDVHDEDESAAPPQTVEESAGATLDHGREVGRAITTHRA